MDDLKPADYKKLVTRESFSAIEFSFIILGFMPPYNLETWGHYGTYKQEVIDSVNETLIRIIDAVDNESLTPVRLVEGIGKTRFSAVDLVKWAVSKDLTIPKELLSILSDEPKSVDIDTSLFSDELRIAISAGQYTATLENPRGGYKRAIETWLEQHYSKDLESSQISRIATLVNKNKKGGAPKS